MTAVNINVTPKRYFPFSSIDDTVHPPEEILKSNTQVKFSGYFSENIADSFYNGRLELGRTFTFRTPTPIMRWHPAKQGTTAKFIQNLIKSMIKT